jgi:CBS domain
MTPACRIAKNPCLRKNARAAGRHLDRLILPCVTGIGTGRSVPESGLFQEVIMFARDVMTPGAEWIAPDLPLAEVGRIMRDKCIGCLPVGENDRLIGIITDRDLGLPCGCRRCRSYHDPGAPGDDAGHHLVLRGPEPRRDCAGDGAEADPSPAGAEQSKADGRHRVALGSGAQGDLWGNRGSLGFSD